MGDVNQEEILIPKGTPLALVIPFKRDTWKMKMSSEKTKQIYFKNTDLFDIFTKE